MQKVYTFKEYSVNTEQNILLKNGQNLGNYINFL